MGSGGRTFPLLPGQGLGPLRLGQCLAETLEIVRLHPNSFRSCEVKYAQSKGLPRPDVALSFPELGFHLLFDGAQQRLRLIEVHDATRLQLSFGGRLLGGGPAPPCFGRVCEQLGPTYPGEPEGGLYPLQYPGVLFLFPLAPGSAAASGQQPRPSLSSSIAGVEFPVALSTPVARILIHHGSAACLAAARMAPPPPLPAGGAYWAPVEAVAGQGLLLIGSGACLRFGDSPQDVISELGEPSSVHTKPGRLDATSLAAPSTPGAAGSASNLLDYFYCFSERGIDVLFCGSSHRLKKLVLHANAPGHADFGLYCKCNFRVHPAGSWSLPSSGSDGIDTEGGGMAWEGGNGGSPHARSSGSEGAGSMKTAASHASLPPEDAHGAAAGLVQQPPPPPQQQQQWGLARHAAHASSAAAGPAGMEQASAGGDIVDSSQTQAGAAAASLGRPPRPPTALPVPTPPPASSSKSGASKKKKKKERQRAAAAAKLGAVSGHGDESATDTDTSFADSAPSSLASSPGMTSFLSNIAVTGGTVGSRLAGQPGCGLGPAAAEALAAPSGYSSDGGSHPSDFLAGKERRMECGSAFDGWSEADDLALLVGGDEPAAPAASAAPADSAAEQHAMRCSVTVQTVPVDEAELALGCLEELPGYHAASAAAAAAAGAGSSPDSFVLAESPALFDEVVAATEYEAVPHLRSCSTQTKPYHVPPGAARRPSSAASGSARLRRPPGTASAACVGVDGSLSDIRAAFGSAAKPALHTRLVGRHPFGPTHLYAFRGAVLEVTRSGAIATVTLFEG